jgi:peptidyl-tRNA hydrolase, PTH1 family
MRLAIGLRNPGPDYAGTRHNIGLEVIAVVLRRHGARLKRGPLRVRAELAEVGLAAERLMLAAPLSFMNQAGGAVKSVLAYHKIALGDLLVVHDDIDLAFGRLRVQNGGGTGGHNGLRSIEGSLGSREFARLKIGIGRPPGEADPADFVLSRFSKTERSEVDLLLEDAADVIERWVTDPVRAQEQAAHRLPG